MIGFEAPLALLALAAAVLPVVAHLLRQQDLPSIRLPTIALLRRAEASSRRRVRLVDLLLLLLRVLLVALAALAIAGPFFRTTLPYGDGSVASVAIVLDDSLSMAGRGDPPLLERAVTRARDAIKSLPEGSEVAVVLAGEPARVWVSRTGDLRAAERALDGIPSRSARGTDLAGALERAERQLAGARHAARRLLVLSDFAAHARGRDVEVPSGLEARFESMGEDVETTNVAVVSARATPDPTTPGRVSVAVEVTASRDLDGRTLPLRLHRGGEELARDQIELTNGMAHATLHTEVDPSDPGATVTVDVDDAIAADNSRGVLLRAPAGARVLLVDGDPHAARGEDEARYFARAIDLAPAEGGALSRRTVDPDTFAAMDLADAEVIVLANVPTVSHAVAARVRQHVERGGGLLITPGHHFDARAARARFGDLLPARPAPAVAVEVGGPVPVPGSPLASAGTSGLEGTRTRQRIALEAIDPSAEVALRFTDGAPALVLKRHGLGRVAVLATTVDDDWTTLPYRVGFLPFVVQLLRELSPSASTPDMSLAPGSVVSLRPPAGAVRMRVLTPSGATLELGEDDLTEDVSFDDTDDAGVYRVQVATRNRPLQNADRLAFLIAPPAEESDLTPGAVADGNASSADAATAGQVVARPVAPWLFLLVGLLALLEAILRLRTTHLLRSPPSGPARPGARART